MGKDTFYELSKRSILLNKNEETRLSWSNSVLTVLTDKGINFIDFSYNLKCMDKKIDFVEQSVVTPKDSPTSELFECKFVRNELQNMDLTDMIIDSAFWPYNSQLVQDMTVVSTFDWSARGFIHNEGVLAVLNNIGGVELFVIQNNKQESILKLSSYVMQNIEYNTSPKTFEQLRESVYKLYTTSICWSNQIGPDNLCYLATAQRNGSIIIWSIKKNYATVKGIIETNTSHIIAITWVSKSIDTFFLICSNFIGQIFVYVCQLNDTIELVESHTPWQFKDRMIAKNFNVMTINNMLIVVCSKHRHLLVQMLDVNCKVISQYLENVNDYRITSITHASDGYYLTTVNGKLYKINISITNNDLKVENKLLEIKDTYSTHEVYSITFSKNNVLLVLGMVDRKVLCRKDALKLDIVFFSTEEKLQSIFPKLLSLNTLRDNFDCVELLRYLIIKQKSLPSIDYNKLYAEAENDIPKLKIYLMFVVLFNYLKRVIQLNSGITLPETSVELIREKILLLHATELLKTLHENYQNSEMLSSFELETFMSARKYIKYYGHKFKKDYSDLISLECSIQKDIVYACQSCDDEIEGFSCKNGHLNLFCSQSFTPIETNDYLTCKCCNFTVRSELSITNPLCLFCDLYLT